LPTKRHPLLCGFQPGGQDTLVLFIGGGGGHDPLVQFD
jgi:hypothetical protein